LRDNFLYKPKWPYFWDLSFLDEHFKFADVRRQSNSPAAGKKECTNSHNYPGLDLPSINYLNGNNAASNLLNNIFNAACVKSPLVDEEEGASTDSAIASSEYSGGDQDFPMEQVSV
jgi:hypothetical protein